MKYDLKKENIFKATRKPAALLRPSVKVLSLIGQGDPNQPGFAVDVKALYAAAYAVKMKYKQSKHGNEYDDYVVPPLQGYWSISKQAQQKSQWSKSDLIYRLELQVPDFVSDTFINDQLDDVKENKSDIPRLNDVKLHVVDSVPVVHVMHVGSYDDEHTSFQIIQDYLDLNDLIRTSKNHREIYLSDARRTAPDKLKTILEVAVQKKV
ncbi:hypothetical protein G7084_03685 [Weissella coleopterorum]|uniref:GyrI-like small molecule binding domain-containing protein n=1 Tax=Weissella coleopterorum TaxID=2714949 RepID=A0A6G8AZV7_9LACO|nr:GyrI-like domain-containing protein [Weissella coleopterorum]QIL50495.1 hypothetical protein G7084_03685 [Weissella coleopterorum]